MEQFHSITLEGGLEVVGQVLPGVQSAALAFFIGAGACDENWEVSGLAHLTESTMFRGTERRASRQLTDELERLGVSRGSSAGLEVTLFNGVLLGDHLPAALEIFVDVIRRPAFPAEELEAVRALQMQEIGQRNDQPAQLVMDRARQVYFAGSPLGHDSLGSPESVQALTRDLVVANWSAHYRPNRSVVAVAGKFEWDELVPQLTELCAGWHGGEERHWPEEPAVNPAVTVYELSIAQENLCFTFPGVSYSDPSYYAAALASMVLGGGMNSRLFSEVREKRGLAYSVGARFDALSVGGLVRVYAGTQPERARESVEVIRTELANLEAGGVTATELELAKTRLKSRVVMNSESTANRVMAIGRDWFYERRFRTLAEVRDQIDATTVDDIAGYLGRIHLTQNLGLMAIGPLSAADLGVADRAFEIAGAP
ncbi:MAG TPA: pitrilysin family protein [Chloroflexota bacterium]|jgi:predicted Zn-dependent peptidase|nr:pitrilysin family protein [Chloroflexota bacterium]